MDPASNPIFRGRCLWAAGTKPACVEVDKAQDALHRTPGLAPRTWMSQWVRQRLDDATTFGAN
ncbi:hypothetical protein CCMA1212_008974 [Trichoderma ghanense]|uniref:Uncharacterized protein n=1 Tax=Trichoderma ghanense TaxID=65468 RepID=A0ABY2GU83_9HYPO